MSSLTIAIPNEHMEELKDKAELIYGGRVELLARPFFILSHPCLSAPIRVPYYPPPPAPP